jgi:hypothetical protein
MAQSRPAINLASLQRLEQLAAAACTLRQIKAICDRAAVARNLARKTRQNVEIQDRANEVKLRAELRGGKMLLECSPHGGNRRSSNRRRSLTMADFGIDHNQSARWRRLAAIPDAVIEEYIATANKRGERIASTGLFRFCADDNGKSAPHNTAALKSTNEVNKSMISGPHWQHAGPGGCDLETTE